MCSNAEVDVFDWTLTSSTCMRGVFLILVYWKKVFECRRANPFTDLDVKSISHALNVLKVLKYQVGCLYNIFSLIITDSVPRLLNYWNFLLAITVLISCSSGFGHSWFWCFHVSRKFINLYILIISFLQIANNTGMESTGPKPTDIHPWKE